MRHDGGDAPRVGSCVLDVHVATAPLPADVAHAADLAALDAVAAGRTGLVHVYGLPGDVLSLGRWHRCPAGGSGVAVHRRRTGGRAAASGDGFLHVAVALPHPAALVADDPRALAPEQVLNRGVRGLLGALESLGIGAHYAGRDLVTAGGRPIAVLGLEIDARGATLLDAIVSVTRDQSLLPLLLDRADRAGVVPAAMVLPDDVTSIARETGRTPGPAELAAALSAGFASRLGVGCVTAPATLLAAGPAAPPGWLASRASRPGLDRQARLTTMLGTLDVAFALGPDGTIADVQLTGDVLASSTAIERLEQALRGARPDPDVLQATIGVQLAPPAFLLGVHPLRALAEAIAAAGARGHP